MNRHKEYASHFANVYVDGDVNASKASNSSDVRPVFILRSGVNTNLLPRDKVKEFFDSVLY